MNSSATAMLAKAFILPAPGWVLACHMISLRILHGKRPCNPLRNDVRWDLVLSPIDLAAGFGQPTVRRVYVSSWQKCV